MSSLSILIPVFWKHSEYLDNLEKQIRTQIIPFSDRVELLILENRGEKSIGKYRQILLEMAVCEYVVFIDADDQISENYISSILSAIDSKPDCIGILGTMTTNGKSPATWEISKALKWTQFKRKEQMHYLRYTNHLAPVKRSIALQIGYKDMGHGEDYDYSERLRKSMLIKTEVKIPANLYHYDFRKS